MIAAEVDGIVRRLAAARRVAAVDTAGHLSARDIDGVARDICAIRRFLHETAVHIRHAARAGRFHVHRVLNGAAGRSCRLAAIYIPQYAARAPHRDRVLFRRIPAVGNTAERLIHGGAPFGFHHAQTEAVVVQENLGCRAGIRIGTQNRLVVRPDCPDPSCIIIELQLPFRLALEQCQAANRLICGKLRRIDGQFFPVHLLSAKAVVAFEGEHGTAMLCNIVIEVECILLKVLCLLDGDISRTNIERIARGIRRGAAAVNAASREIRTRRHRALIAAEVDGIIRRLAAARRIAAVDIAGHLSACDIDGAARDILVVRSMLDIAAVKICRFAAFEIDTILLGLSCAFGIAAVDVRRFAALDRDGVLFDRSMIRGIFHKTAVNIRHAARAGLFDLHGILGRISCRALRPAAVGSGQCADLPIHGKLILLRRIAMARKAAADLRLWIRSVVSPLGVSEAIPRQENLPRRIGLGVRVHDILEVAMCAQIFLMVIVRNRDGVVSAPLGERDAHGQAIPLPYRSIKLRLDIRPLGGCRAKPAFCKGKHR